MTIENYSKKNPETIKELFNSISSRYDLTNTCLSFHLHSYWNNLLVKMGTKSTSPKKVLDLCGGTGDISYRLLRYIEKNKIPLPIITLADFAVSMLDVAKQRNEYAHFQNQLTLIEADAHVLPFENNSFDTTFIAYGVRNLHDPLKAFHEVYRTLNTHGTIAILELTRPTNPLLKLFHKIYLKTFVPCIGRLTTKNKKAYSYLISSIAEFMTQEELTMLLKNAGFSNVKSKRLFGGIATILIGKK